jgi:hypothetical protein
MLHWSRATDSAIQSERVEAIKDMNRKQLQITQTMMDKLTEAVDYLDPAVMKPGEITNMMKFVTQLQKDMDPNLSLVLQEADETEYVDARAGHCTHVLILAGTMTEKQRKDEVDRILQELQNYSFVSIRDVAYPED